MIAVAQHLATEASRASKRRKVSHMHMCQPSTSILVGARISVYWADDDAYYKVGCCKGNRHFSYEKCSQ